jgi:hypothetical protein
MHEHRIGTMSGMEFMHCCATGTSAPPGPPRLPREAPPVVGAIVRFPAALDREMDGSKAHIGSTAKNVQELVKQGCDARDARAAQVAEATLKLANDQRGRLVAAVREAAGQEGPQPAASLINEVGAVTVR